MIKSAEIGSYSFILGIFLAIISGLLPSMGGLQSYIPLALLILGFLVGLLNISGKESTNFLIAAIALMLTQNATSGVALIPLVGAYLVSVLNNLSVFVAPAALIVALKDILQMAKDR
jgi:hypothetical protein